MAPKHHDKNSSCRKFSAGDKESDSQYDRTIENKSGCGRFNLSNPAFSVSLFRMELMILNIIQIRMINIPKPMAITKTAFSLPTSGTSIIWFIGFSHMAFRTSSKPKKLPYMKPKNTENTPAQLMIPARSICLVL